MKLTVDTGALSAAVRSLTGSTGEVPVGSAPAVGGCGSDTVVQVVTDFGSRVDAAMKTLNENLSAHTTRATDAGVMYAEQESALEREFKKFDAARTKVS